MAMLLLMIDMMRNHGLRGLALSRLGYGSVSLLVYIPLLQQLYVKRSAEKSVSPLSIPFEVQEGSEP